MLLYLLKRILYFIPTLLLVSIIIFFLSKCAGEELQCIHDRVYDEAKCIEEATLKGFNKPIFYFNLTTTAHPDTLHRIIREERRSTLKKLITQYGNWKEIQSYYKQIDLLNIALAKAQLKTKSNALIKMRADTKALFVHYKAAAIEDKLISLTIASADSSVVALVPQVNLLKKRYKDIQSNSTKKKLYIPQFIWNGIDNQYHFWFSNFISGNWGKSVRDNRTVIAKIGARLPWTLAITIPAILLAYLLSIPIGVYTAVYKKSKLDKRLSTFLLFLFSLPLFWIGTLAVMFFTTPAYGMPWFPSIGLQSLSSEEPIWSQILKNASKLILPIICITYSSLAFISRQLRSSMIEALQQDYIRTAKAKGLSQTKVIWKHAFRNALFPLITMFANVLPAAFAGSVIIEVIFNIQGMGYLLFDSIQNRDWQVVYAIVMIASVLTIIGILLADILYALVDPRVRFRK